MAADELPERIGDDSVRTIRNAIATLREERSSFEAFMEGMLDALEEMRSELLGQEKDLRTARTDLRTRQTKLDEALVKAAEASKVNSEAETQIKHLTRDLADTKSRVESIERERDTAISKMNDAVDELTAVADALDLVQSTERELARTRDELSDAKEQLQTYEGASSEDVDQLREEKNQLETDLKAALAESARLSSKVTDQRRQLDEQRDKMSNDLGDLKAALKDRIKSLRE